MKQLILRATLALSTSACVSSHAIHEAQYKDLALRDLDQIYADLRRSYYDAAFHGENMKLHYDEARVEIRAAHSDQERFHALYKFLLPLNDSHTMYIGGNNFGIGDYGFGYRFYGESVYVSAVDEQSIADSVGLRRGDQIVSFDNKVLKRETYVGTIVEFLGQHPIPPLELVVRAPDGSVSTLTLHADTAWLRKLKGRDFRRLYSSARDSVRQAQSHVTASFQKKVFYWKIPEFELADIKLGSVARDADKHETVILDLRGNPGGPIDQLKEVLQFFVEKPTEIGHLESRWEKKTYVAKPKGSAFKGRLIVLIDSETSSAAEVCARLLQLDRKALVVGDRSAGAVMVASQYGMAYITISDFVLHNGERLERRGVQPDITIVPSQSDILSGADPVLAYAIGQAGVQISPAQAGRLSVGRP